MVEEGGGGKVVSPSVTTLAVNPSALDASAFLSWVSRSVMRVAWSFCSRTIESKEASTAALLACGSIPMNKLGLGQVNQG